MELSLWGAFILLVLVNPVVFVATYDWWLCFFGVCAYFAVAFLIYEVILWWLLCVVPGPWRCRYDFIYTDTRLQYRHTSIIQAHEYYIDTQLLYRHHTTTI